MNRGKRCILHTVLAMHGLTILVAGATWLYGSTVHAGTPQWLRSLMSLGLQVTENRDTSASPAAINLNDLRNFTQLHMDGNFKVEIIGAENYRISVTPADGKQRNLGVAWIKDGVLQLTGNTNMHDAVLRVETPALDYINVSRAQSMTVKGLTVPQLTIHMKDVAELDVQESAVGQWILYSRTPVKVQLDKATSSTGLRLQATGRVSIRYEQ